MGSDVPRHRSRQDALLDAEPTLNHDLTDVRVGVQSAEWQGSVFVDLQRLAVRDRQKLFESEYASLVIDSAAG